MAPHSPNQIVHAAVVVEDGDGGDGTDMPLYYDRRADDLVVDIRKDPGRGAGRCIRVASGTRSKKGCHNCSHPER